MVEIKYQVVEGEMFEGAVNAYALVAKANIWYLVAEKSEGEFRNYRLGRIKEMRLTDQRFVRQPFDLAAYWEESCRRFEQISAQRFPPYVALLRVKPGAFWYFPGFLEGHYEQIGGASIEGSVMLRVTFDSLADARTRILGLGTGVEVLESEELRQSVIETARAVLQAYESGNH
ncbi:MAG: WYL domain-containing protein [Anaerolineae bacterium]